MGNTTNGLNQEVTIMKKFSISTFAAMMLLTGRLGIAQTPAKSGDEPTAVSRPLMTRHLSKGKVADGAGDYQAIGRETADALAGKIEQPFMAPTRSSFLAKWKPMSGATGYR